MITQGNGNKGRLKVIRAHWGQVGGISGQHEEIAEN